MNDPGASGWPPPSLPPTPPTPPPWQPPGAAPPWGTPTGWAPQPPPRRRPRVGAVIAGVIIAVLVVPMVVVFVVAGFSGSSSRTPRPFESGLPSSPAPPYADLMASPAPGYSAVSDGLPGSGPLTVDKLAQSSSNPTGERAALRSSGFLDGYARQWINGRGTGGYYIRIYRLADTIGASLFLSLDIKGTGKLGPVSIDAATKMTVIRPTKPDTSGNWPLVVLAMKGNYVVVAREYSNMPIASSDFLTGVVARQVIRVPAT